MLKIQYGIAGFFIGAFTGLLLGLVEMRIINSSKHPTRLFITIAVTIIVCGIIGVNKGLKIARKRMKQ
jgi:ABC-type xylose transport system permease subunit